MALRLKIGFHRAVVVEMFLIKIEKQRNMGGNRGVGKLMAGHLIHHDGILRHLVKKVKAGGADVAQQNHRPPGAGTQHGVQHGGSGALALGAGDADDPASKLLQKKLRLGGKLRILILHDDAGAFDH